MDIRITKNPNPKSRPEDDALTFGTTFTDHMFIMDYHVDKGWHDARIVPYAPFEMDPSSAVLHYSQTIFEGLKAYRTEDDTIQLFRPEDNFARFNKSASRMCMPEFDEAFALEALKKLVAIDADWVPRKDGTSLYIRPTLIATDPFLGVHASKTYRFFIILSPVGAYYAEGFNPVKIQVISDYVRAVKGGVGEAKTGGNYAASLLASEKAAKEGFTQVLWLDGADHKYIEEVGAMNIFFVIDGELVTPELSGSILDGITRKSVIQAARAKGLTVSERRISVDEIRDAAKSGRLNEAFGSGTAAVISPVGLIRIDGEDFTIGGGKVGAIAGDMFDTITGIQYGRKEDVHGWIQAV